LRGKVSMLIYNDLIMRYSCNVLRDYAQIMLDAARWCFLLQCDAARCCAMANDGAR
jgi:hypothetical protein